MKMGKPRILVVATVLIAAAATLSGCFYAPGLEPEGGSSPTPAPTFSSEAVDTPSVADPAIVVLAENEVVPLPEFTRSTPAGTWPVGTGIPAGFPAGVPVYPDRWIENQPLEFETQDGRYGYSAMFWGGYDHVDQLIIRLEELGFDVEEQSDDTKRAIVADSDRYRVVINATETAKNPGEEEFLDPAYTIIVVAQD